jgi:hypothetical protein
MLILDKDALSWLGAANARPQQHQEIRKGFPAGARPTFRRGNNRDGGTRRWPVKNGTISLDDLAV